MALLATCLEIDLERYDEMVFDATKINIHAIRPRHRGSVEKQLSVQGE
jgi:hypothetical protein